MSKAMLRAILILPGTVLVWVPGLILWLSASGRLAGALAPAGSPHFWAALALAVAGVVLMGLALRQFGREGGGGTPAPWDPRRFVAGGVYRHVRNPMISGVIAALYGEAFLFQSLPVLAWAVLFMLANLAYIPLVEEPGLERRFGADYRRYKANVPRWIPLLGAWTPPGPAEGP